MNDPEFTPYTEHKQIGTLETFATQNGHEDFLWGGGKKRGRVEERKEGIMAYVRSF